MTRVLALILCIVGVWATVAAVERAPVAPYATALAVGFALLAAPVAGALFERLRLPRVSGYLVFGLLCGPYILDIITRPMARELRVVNGIAVALIAFVAGLELNYARLRPRLRAIGQLGGSTLLVMYAAMLPAVWLVWPWLPILPEASGLARVAVTLLLTTVLVSFSPTVTIAVIADTRSRGPLSELVVAVVILADLVLILGFTLAMQFARWTLDAGQTTDVGLFVRLTWEIGGSLAFGAFVGAVFALYLRYVGRELTLVLLALCVVLSEVAVLFHAEPLLAALAAGLVVENIAASSGDALRDAVERGALPVLVVFFAAAGASLNLDALARLGWVAIALVALRLAFIRAGVIAGVWAAGLRGPAELVWMGLVSQAGVTLGLAVLVAKEFPDWGAEVQVLVVALSGLHVLVGPILFRAGLARAGEIGRMDDPAAQPRHT
jgi:Kef-type K+ transport system membrane component KefB